MGVLYCILCIAVLLAVQDGYKVSAGFFHSRATYKSQMRQLLEDLHRERGFYNQPRYFVPHSWVSESDPYQRQLVVKHFSKGWDFERRTERTIEDERITPGEEKNLKLDASILLTTLESHSSDVWSTKAAWIVVGEVGREEVVGSEEEVGRKEVVKDDVEDRDLKLVNDDEEKQEIDTKLNADEDSDEYHYDDTTISEDADAPEVEQVAENPKSAEVVKAEEVTAQVAEVEDVATDTEVPEFEEVSEVIKVAEGAIYAKVAEDAEDAEVAEDDRGQYNEDEPADSIQ